MRQNSIVNVTKPYKFGPMQLKRWLQILTLILYGVSLSCLIHFLISMGTVDQTTSRIIYFINVTFVFTAAVKYTLSVFNEPESYGKRKAVRHMPAMLMIVNFLNGLNYVQEHMTPNRVTISLTCGVQAILSLVWLATYAWQLELEEEYLSQGKQLPG